MMAFAAPFLPLLMIAGTAFTAVSGYQQAQYQAQVAKNNQQLANRNAALASEAAQKEQMRSDQEYAGMLGEQEAIQGASGLDVLGRSQLAVRNQTRRVRGLAAQDIRAQGDQQVAGHFQDAANFAAEASAAKISGITSLVGGALDIGRMAQGGKLKGLGSLGGRKKRMPWSNGGTATWHGHT
jgi:hypothetical protein